ncbi:energy transducer TonB [Phaeovibrio sulfidiphilus]|uniref:Energy transducer TonB n=1 Tax=Phaeovibrio sulfidiphilus TaxID=1220600 RepID=A0A8J7CCS2_9PROT|nr:energy transducer TonB [Phaeovibrio sulfidiphilus]
MIRSCARPPYPEGARHRGETGTVILNLKIDASGRLVDRAVVVSSGHARLDTAALNGLARCRFAPATRNGVPEPGWVKLRYVWTLD